MRKELTFIGIFLGVLAVVFMAGRCSNSGTISDYEKQIEGSRLENVELKKERNKIGELLVRANYNTETVMQISKTKDSALLAIAKEVGGLKRIISTISYTTVTRDTFSTTIKERIIVDNTDTLKAGSVDIDDGYLKLQGLVVKDKFRGSYSYQERNSITTYWEGKRLQKKTLAVLVKPSNPHTDITNLKPLHVKPPKKKWYETRAAAFVIGAVTGAALMIAK